MGNYISYNKKNTSCSQCSKIDLIKNLYISSYESYGWFNIHKKYYCYDCYYNTKINIVDRSGIIDL